MRITAVLLFIMINIQFIYSYTPLEGNFQRDNPNDIRIVAYNTERNLVDTSSLDDEFERILSTLDPDVIVFEEVITEVSDQQVKAKLDAWIPIGGFGWQVHRGEGSYIQTMVLSRYPMTMTRTDTTPDSNTRGVTMALVDLPDAQYSTDVYIMGVHLKCCDRYSTDQEKRQESADAIANWMADARTTGGNIDLPEGTPMIVLGDFNLVGGDNGDQPEQTLITGDIQDEATYGADRKGDWDNTDLLDLTPANPFNGSTGTWSSSYATPFSRLDRFLITDSVIDVANSGVLNTMTMSSSVLSAAGLQSDDTESAADHLPIYMDMRFQSMRGVFQIGRESVTCTDQLEVVLSDLNMVGEGSVGVEALSFNGDSLSMTLLEESPANGTFFATLSISTLDEPDTLQVEEGGTVILNYLDNDIGGGVSETIEEFLTVDCTLPVITTVEVQSIEARSASIRVVASEEVTVTIDYGSTCGNTPSSVVSSEYLTETVLNLDGLQPGTGYTVKVTAKDKAGNEMVDDNEGSCYQFSTLDQAEYYTEYFLSSDFDLENTSLLFTPQGNGYQVCRTDISTFAYSDVGTSLTLDDDDWEEVTLTGGKQFPFAGSNYQSVFVSSNGYITFESGDDEYTTSVDNHFSTPRLSVLFDDLTPGSGSITYEQYSDRLVITGLDIPEYSESNFNNFQVELHFDGTIRMSWLQVEATELLVGFSQGDTVPDDLQNSDLSTSFQCSKSMPNVWLFH